MKIAVVLHSDDGQRYGVTVPDLAGCFSAGDSIDEALESVKEAIELHLEGLLDEGDDMPMIAPISQHQANPDYTGGVWAVVDIDTSAFEGETEQINVTLPKLLIKRIDDYTQAKHLTRSVFLAEAARAAMR
jgi:predicted RNase H-like HicB family nuclease